jgi:hypothetical protein
MLATLAAIVASVGPLALFGGPLGLAIAWVGSTLKSGAAKWIVIGLGLLLLVGVSVGLTVYVERLKQDRAAYILLLAKTTALEKARGCDLRENAAERDLATCLTAIERDAQAARSAKLAEFNRRAAQAQADLNAANTALAVATGALDQFIDTSAQTGDGPVPKVMRDLWGRQRSERGQKP